jgi:hypothetical protein
VMFIIMQFSPWSVFLPFRSKYLPQHSALHDAIKQKFCEK